MNGYAVTNSILNEMTWSKTMKAGSKKIFKRMLKKDKLSTAIALTPAPFPTAPVGIGVHLYKNPESAKTAKLMTRKTWRAIKGKK